MSATPVCWSTTSLLILRRENLLATDIDPRDDDAAVAESETKTLRPSKASSAPDSAQERAVSWRAFFSTYLPALILALGTGVALPAIPALARSFDVSFGVASGVLIAFLIGNVAGTVPSGWLIDRFGRRRVMIAGPLITAVTAFMVAGAGTFGELLVYRFVGGFAAQMWLMSRLAAISHGAAANQRGRQVSWMFGMDHTGKVAGPLVGGFLAAQWGLRAPFVAYGILALVALAPAFFLAHDTPSLERPTSTSPSRAKLTIREIVSPRLVYFGVALFAGLARGPVQADLLHLYAAFNYDLDAQQIGYMATGAAVLSLPIGFLAGWLMDRFGRKVTMVPGFVGVSLAMVALALSAFLQLSLFWYVVLFLIGITAQALTGGSIQTVGADVAPPEARGMFLGLWRFTGTGGSAIGPLVFAALAETAGYGFSFLFIAASAGVVGHLLIRFIPETRAAR